MKMDNNNNNNDEQQSQHIVTDCSPTFCACDPNLDRCQQGFLNNRAHVGAEMAESFHLYRIQQRVDASVQSAYHEESTSWIRRHLMASRFTTQQNPASMWGRFQRNARVARENSLLLSRRPSNTASRPFGILVPEQAAIGPLQHLAAPQGRDTLSKDDDLVCDHTINYCVSGDSNSSHSLEQSRKKKKD